MLPALRMGTVIMSFCGGCPGKAGPLSSLHLGTHTLLTGSPGRGPEGDHPIFQAGKSRHRPGGAWPSLVEGGAELGWTPGSPVLLTAKLTVTRERGEFLPVTPRLYSPWNSPGQNIGEGGLSILQGIFPTQGSNPGLPHLQEDSLPAEPPGKPF